MTKRFSLWIGIGAVALFGMAGCARDRPEPARAEPVAVRVATARVSRSEVGVLVPIPGIVSAQGRATLAARVAAAVVALPFREGESVAAGAILVRLDDHALRSCQCHWSPTD